MSEPEKDPLEVDVDQLERQREEVEKVKRSANGIIPDPVTLPPDESVGKAREVMAQQNVSGVPITEDRVMALSEHGTVARGICAVSPDGKLQRVVERTDIGWVDGVLRSRTTNMRFRDHENQRPGSMHLNLHRTTEDFPLVPVMAIRTGIASCHRRRRTASTAR